MIKNMLGCIALTLVAGLTVVACQRQEKTYIGGPYYFELFVGYGKPFVPAKEISYDQAQELDAYYVAYYDAKGRIIAFVKYLYGNFEFCDLYYYQPSGKLELIEYYKSNREKGTHVYDESGTRIIRQTKSRW